MKLLSALKPNTPSWDEAAFALGQIQNANAIPTLETVLNDLSLHPIVCQKRATILGDMCSLLLIDLSSSSLRATSVHLVDEDNTGGKNLRKVKMRLIYNKFKQSRDMCTTEAKLLRGRRQAPPR
ncbi:hypothetical protein LguiA_011587 [Lonicera macranthoides]